MPQTLNGLHEKEGLKSCEAITLIMFLLSCIVNFFYKISKCPGQGDRKESNVSPVDKILFYRYKTINKDF
jgi:hypothetical protein